ncbi:electron transport complex subunit RsxG [Thiofaba sp. EF100]|uniref:electron transport complex subunit RsxG n=1 Tax=Thiofaba sp. EF100 TaxID=3121274 RepID=UPI00322213E0
MNRTQIILTALVLAVFAFLGVGIVAFMHGQTAPLIAEQARAALGQRLAAVLPAGYDNDPARDTRQLAADPLLGGKGPVMLYVARKDGRVHGVAFEVVAPKGYSGGIQLLVGVDRNGQVSGVRVLSHKETPGLGDPIEVEKSDWIHGFTGKTLDNPGEKGWAVKKDGGVFDQFTGATITPRAVVTAVHDALRYFEAHRAALLEEQQP